MVYLSGLYVEPAFVRVGRAASVRRRVRPAVKGPPFSPSCMYFLYSVLSAAGVLLLSPYFLIKGLRQKKYLRNLPERFAWRFPPGLESYRYWAGSK